MSRPPLLLLPPSEGKARGGRTSGRPDSLAEELAAPRAAVLVPSGLYGLTTAADPVADYRLKLLVSLGRLSTFRRPALTAALTARARGRVVTDLRPAEHAHALDLRWVAGAARVVHLGLVGADGRRAVGHGAKGAKGRLARALLEGVSTPSTDVRTRVGGPCGAATGRRWWPRPDDVWNVPSPPCLRNSYVPLKNGLGTAGPMVT